MGEAATRDGELAELPRFHFLHETEAIANGNQNHLHPGIADDRIIEGTDGSDVLVVREIADHVAALQRVVQQDQASWPQAGQHLFVVLGVAGLVGVDEREVELLARWQCAQGFQARTDP